MIATRTRLVVLDNSGIVTARCVGILRYSFCRYGKVGDLGVFSFIKKTPKAHLFKSKVHMGIVVGVKKKTMYRNSICVSFPYNGVLFVKWDSKIEMVVVGPRIRGAVSTVCVKRRFLVRDLSSKVRRFF